MRQKNRGHSQSESQIDLMIRGMEAQLVEWESRLPKELTTIRTFHCLPPALLANQLIATQHPSALASHSRG